MQNQFLTQNKENVKQKNKKKLRTNEKQTDTDTDRRQYRCELPPEFPLTLPCSSIVPHLSGPDTCALSSSTLKIAGGCRCTNPRIHILCACTLNTRKLAHMSNSSQEHTGTNKHRETCRQTQTDTDTCMDTETHRENTNKTR